MGFKVISFYRYTKIEEPQELIKQLRSICKELNILGRILIGNEGINGAISGRTEKIKKLKEVLQNNFQNLTFREQDYYKNTYHKLIIRQREEVCAFETPTNVKNTGNHLKPEELYELYKNNEDFTIIDARNDYEFNVGRFKNAVKLPIKNFREFSSKGLKTLQPFKEKKVILYCTGGVRCEKASAYLKEQGFKDVNQLDGGIINYVNKFPNTNWEGGLFVFDDRLVSNVGQPITTCQFCKEESQQYTNCHNIECDKLFISCQNCLIKHNNSCSEICQSSNNRRKNINKPREIIGTITNYYKKNKVALVKLNDKLFKNNKISILGKTTKEFSQPISEIRDYGGNIITQADKDNLITISVKEKVRRNDKVCLV